MKTNSIETLCPLCNREKINLFFEDKNRTYLSCIYCKLVFVPKCFWLNAEDEKATYDLHENDSQDQGYRKFLSRLCLPLLERLNPDATDKTREWVAQATRCLGCEATRGASKNLFY